MRMDLAGERFQVEEQSNNRPSTVPILGDWGDSVSPQSQTDSDLRKP